MGDVLFYVESKVFGHSKSIGGSFEESSQATKPEKLKQCKVFGHSLVD